MIPNETARDRIWKRSAHMEAERRLFEPLWVELRDNFLPTRGRFDKDGEHTARAPKRNSLPNSTPLYAMRTLASGLHAGLTSPARPWFKMTLREDALAEFGPVKIWLGQAEERLRQAFSGSNFYEMLPFMYAEYGTFGTMCGLCLEDDGKPHVPFRFEWYTAGQYHLATDAFGRYDSLFRDYAMTVRQVVTRFGMKRVSTAVQKAWASGNYEQKVWIRHTIEPAQQGSGFDSCYWERTRPDRGDGLLAKRNIASNPVIAAAWERMYSETYGTSCPGIVALGDAKALQIDEIGKARGIDRQYNPPLQGPPLTGRNGVSLLPGAYNELATMATGPSAGIRSLYDFTPDIRGLLDNIGRGERRIEQSCYTDLFLMLTMDERAQRATAEEIRARYDEKVLALGPTLEQCNSMLRGVIDRGMEIMIRRSRPIWEGVLDGDPLLPPPPEELMDREIDVEFVSTLHQALRATTLQGIERFAAFAGQMAQMTGQPPDKFNAEQALDEYALGVGVTPTVVRSDDEVAALQAQRAQQQQMAQMAQMAGPMKDGAQAMSQLATTAPAEDSILASLAGGGM
jgi:hypothetical protein